MSETAEAALALTGGALLLTLTAALIALMAGGDGLPPNRAVGIRTRATRSSPQAWAAAHRAARPLLWRGAALGALLVLVAAVALVLHARGDGEGPAAAVALTAAVSGFVGVTAAVLWGGVRGQRAARRVQAAETP